MRGRQSPKPYHARVSCTDQWRLHARRTQCVEISVERGANLCEAGFRTTWDDYIIAVIFEAEPAVDHMQDYFDIASDIRPMRDEIDGFVSVERFQSLNDPKKLLSLSFFKNEEAVRQWCVHCQHREAQSKGRDGLFVDFRSRVAMCFATTICSIALRPLTAAGIRTLNDRSLHCRTYLSDTVRANRWLISHHIFLKY